MKQDTLEGKAKTKNGVKRLCFSIICILLEVIFIITIVTRLNEYAEIINLVSNHQFNWWFIISPPKGYCYCSPQRAVSQALLLARYKAVLLDSSACSFIYF